MLKIDAKSAECPILVRAPEGCFASIREVVFEYHTFAGCGLDAIRRGIEVFGFEYAACAKEANLFILRPSGGLNNIGEIISKGQNNDDYPTFPALVTTYWVISDDPFASNIRSLR